MDLATVFDESVRGAPDRAALGAKVNVPVPADSGVAGPFVTGEGQEAAVLLELGGQLVDVVPERAVDLKIVGLMACRIEKREVAREGEVLARGVDSH